jgi:hypothetical protein
MSLCPFCLTSVQPHLQAAAYLHKIWVALESQGLQVTTTVCIGDLAGEILQLAEQRGMNLIIINSH